MYSNVFIIYELSSAVAQPVWNQVELLPCYTAVAQLGFKRRATATLKSN